MLCVNQTTTGNGRVRRSPADQQVEEAISCKGETTKPSMIGVRTWPTRTYSTKPPDLGADGSDGGEGTSKPTSPRCVAEAAGRYCLKRYRRLDCSDEPLIRPCACRGTAGCVHLSCLVVLAMLTEAGWLLDGCGNQDNAEPEPVA